MQDRISTARDTLKERRSQLLANYAFRVALHTVAAILLSLQSPSRHITSEGSTVKLVGKDGEREFEISKDAVRLSRLVANTPKEQGDDDVIHLPNVSPDCVEKIVAFLSHYAEEPVVYMARMRFDGSNFRVVVGDATPKQQVVL